MSIQTEKNSRRLTKKVKLCERIYHKAKSEWDKDTILKLNSYAIKWYTDGFNIAPRLLGDSRQS